MSYDPTALIDALVAREGGYSSVTDDPADNGGLTRAGITQAAATAAGLGDVRSLSDDDVRGFYLAQYWTAPRFDQVAAVSGSIAAKLFDIKVNGGPGVQFMQRALCVLGHSVATDGGIGPGTLAALGAYLQQRGAGGERVLVFMIAALQAARYIGLAEADSMQQRFEYGWIAQRAMYEVAS